MGHEPEPEKDGYQLLPLSERHLRTLYEWTAEERHFERYTCRPLAPRRPFEEYAGNALRALRERQQRIYVLVRGEDCGVPLGKATLFDFNPRNHSAEFGYYLPERNRGRGLGGVLLAKFVEAVFGEDDLELNKLYATTASNNAPSIGLLERFGFQLDGRLREHYWIDGERHDQLVYSMLRAERGK